MEMSRPVDNFTVGVRALLCAKGWPTDQTFEHDRANAPPVASKIVAFTREDLRGNIVGGANSRVCELSARFAPRVDLSTIADSELYLVQ